MATFFGKLTLLLQQIQIKRFFEKKNVENNERVIFCRDEAEKALGGIFLKLILFHNLSS